MRPTGRVSFLFTDVEGSTTRWESHREAMQDALRRHDALLQAAIADRGGYVFKTIGDAFCAAFTDPLDAVEAAVDAQRRLAADDFSAVGGLRVRMAIHAGETDERDGDYFGPPVNRVARLLATGHGGQVLVSGYAGELIGSRLPAGMSLRHLGTLPLRDLKEPERVHQLVAEGLAASFKALRSLQTPPNNLPASGAAIFGRLEDSGRVAEMLRHGRLVTLVGAGGIGKTRLALDVAGTLLNESSDGAWFVDLSPLSDGSHVEGAILSALGAEQGDGAPLDRLVAYLRKRSLLLVLDNCEQVIESAAAVSSAILANCPETAVLATSREALGIAGESVYHLSTLDPAAAIELFAERARAVNRHFALTDANRPVVAEICHRLDGMALGVELAAARARSMSVESRAQRLELRMLSRGGRDRSARQQTMHGLIGWSYDLLGDQEKALFRSLSVFAGGFTLESAALVCAGDGIDDWQVLDLLTSLAEKSLLVAEPADAPERYRMLQPIREYARELLDECGETGAVRARHARAFADIADRAYEEWDTAPAPDWLDRQTRELDNVREALRWSLEGGDATLGARIAGSAGPVFLRLSLLREGEAWGERAISNAAGLPDAVAARLYYALSMLRNNLGDAKMALAAAERAASAYRAAADERGLARALSQVAQQRANEGQKTEARIAADDCLALARRLNDRATLATALARCTNVLEPNDLGTMRAWYRESVALFRSLGRENDVARVLMWWAGTEGLAGCLAEAASIIEEALPLASGDLKAWVTASAATFYWAVGQGEKGEAMTRSALALTDEPKHPILFPSVVGLSALAAGRTDAMEAARLLGYAESRRSTTGYTPTAFERGLVDDLIAQLRAAIPEPDLRAAWSEGAAWNEEQASARAARV